MAAFFKTHTLDQARVLFWQLFRCWSTKECKIITEVSDEEVALFFDQLIDLVAAVHRKHQANRALENGQEGSISE